jgi:hypothetical protein
MGDPVYSARIDGRSGVRTASCGASARTWSQRNRTGLQGASVGRWGTEVGHGPVEVGATDGGDVVLHHLTAAVSLTQGRTA